jgi:serine/threonine protein kinase
MKVAAVVSDERAESLSSGALVGDYRIVRRRAAGGMGEVYVTTHLRRPGRYALKVLNPTLKDDSEAVARFAREARLMSRVQHPNVVRLIDFDLAGAIPFLAMENLEGLDLHQQLLEHGPLALDTVTVIVVQIARALEYAHARGIAHCDVKPSNVVLVEQSGWVAKLVDFGVARFFGSWSRAYPGEHQDPGTDMLGTPAYMAPEQAQGRSSEIDGRTDQFALAALAYVLLAGDDPFPGTTTAEVLAGVLHEEPAPLAGRVGWAAEPVDSVLRRGLSKCPADRYESVSELAVELVAAAARAGAAATGNRPQLAGQRRQAELSTCRASRAGVAAEGVRCDRDLVAAARIGYQTTFRLPSVLPRR